MTLTLATTFTIAKDPPEGGRYILFRKADNPAPSPFDRIQVFGFRRVPFGFDVDPLEKDLGGWTLKYADLIDIFMDHRDDLPVFIVVELNGKFCRVEQVGGTRVVDGLKSVWLSVACIRSAVDYGTLELLS